MPIGPFVRQLVGPRLERGLSYLYRRVFVDLDAVARAIALQCTKNVRMLDLGGGDGELVNKILALRPDLQIDMVDIAAVVGRFLVPEVRDRVRLFPGTAIEALPDCAERYGAALVSDVMHHLPPLPHGFPHRGAFQIGAGSGHVREGHRARASDRLPQPVLRHLRQLRQGHVFGLDPRA